MTGSGGSGFPAAPSIPQTGGSRRQPAPPRQSWQCWRRYRTLDLGPFVTWPAHTPSWLRPAGRGGFIAMGRQAAQREQPAFRSMGDLDNEFVPHEAVERIDRAANRHADHPGQRRRRQQRCSRQHVDGQRRPEIAPPINKTTPRRHPFPFQIHQQLMVIQGLAGQRLQKNPDPGDLFRGRFGRQRSRPGQRYRRPQQPNFPPETDQRRPDGRPCAAGLQPLPAA